MRDQFNAQLAQWQSTRLITVRQWIVTTIEYQFKDTMTFQERVEEFNTKLESENLDKVHTPLKVIKVNRNSSCKTLTAELRDSFRATI